MSVELIGEPKPITPTTEEDCPPLPPTDLIYDDGEPLESNRHRIAMNVLISSVHQAYQEREDYFTGGNMFVYYSTEQVRNRDFRGPDFFVVLNVDGAKERRSWITWEEKGRYPDVIVELMSASTAAVDVEDKKEIYERTFRTQDYFVYDPFNEHSLQGWHLGARLRYEAIAPNERGWLWCETLGLWLGTWKGTLTKEYAPWLRFYDSQGELILLPEEVAQQQQARAEREQQRAEREQQRAEQEQQRAESAERIADEERRKNQQLRQRLLELGVDPDSLS